VSLVDSPSVPLGTLPSTLLELTRAPPGSRTPSSKVSYHALYVGAFKNITSDWRKYKGSLGTQHVLLDLVCDVAMRGLRHGNPTGLFLGDIFNELLKLLRNILEGQPGPCIDNAMERLRAVRGHSIFLDMALNVVASVRALPEQVPSLDGNGNGMPVGERGAEQVRAQEQGT
jgi:hypothetical protein